MGSAFAIRPHPSETRCWDGLDNPLIAWLWVVGRLTAGTDRAALSGELTGRLRAFQQPVVETDRRLTPTQSKSSLAGGSSWNRFVTQRSMSVSVRSASIHHKVPGSPATTGLYCPDRLRSCAEGVVGRVSYDFPVAIASSESDLCRAEYRRRPKRLERHLPHRGRHSVCGGQPISRVRNVRDQRCRADFRDRRLGAVGADRAVVPPEYHQPAGLLRG